ncbi:hypothetical protein NGR_c12840 [Sinorhizobium fredii NGR234]|uniref:Transmembrane protein n=1 Tax=Sinorhizobium fredii (strain NBRC 101917 / NGR234) TaxID=394 RepID=C3MBK3_SINFN|nr:hypothetical protein [Sinorhizobium fredii]ACP25065.1 hypothetical protein NGR_c12840 [Sinorhizobium fredii NGR234]
MATLKETRRIAWSLYWKSSLLCLLTGAVAGAVFGFIVGFIGGFAGVRSEILAPIYTWGGSIVGLLAGFVAFNFVVAWTIGKSIGGQQLELAVATSFREGQ